MVQYIYEADYDPKFTEIPERTSTDGRPRKNPDGFTYTYAFPHTCDTTGWLCLKKTLCSHHTCYRHTCGFTCDGFVCKKCTDPTELDISAADQLILHAGMYAIGDKYDVHGLDVLAKAKFKRTCDSSWNTAEFADAAQYVCDEPVDGLREVIVETIVEHMEMIKTSRIKEMLQKSDGLTYEVLRRILG
jgi:hypothetical protein